MKDSTTLNGSHLFLGMVHLLPLPGSPRYHGDLEPVIQHALRDAASLAQGGVDGFIVENFCDVPFYPDRVPAETIAAMTAVAVQLRANHPQLLIGVNVLRNDANAALAVALAANCDFIRVNILNGVRLTDQGLIQGRGHELLRDRKRLNASAIRVFADIDVKHSAPLAQQSLELQAEELASRGGADGLIVSGAGTGKAASIEQLRAVQSAVNDKPILVGSGVNLANLERLAEYATGFIVGSSLKADDQLAQPVDADRVAQLATAIRKLS